jgi:hypothetical protein
MWSADAPGSAPEVPPRRCRIAYPWLPPASASTVGHGLPWPPGNPAEGQRAPSLTAARSLTHTIAANEIGLLIRKEG